MKTWCAGNMRQQKFTAKSRAKEMSRDSAPKNTLTRFGEMASGRVGCKFRSERRKKENGDERARNGPAVFTWRDLVVSVLPSRPPDPCLHQGDRRKEGREVSSVKL